MLLCSVQAGTCWDSNFKHTTISSFQILTYSSPMDSLPHSSYTTSGVQKVSSIYLGANPDPTYKLLLFLKLNSLLRLYL
jgi:hypothetical protein